ncbi:MAG TPA: type II toxin-antitoxin system antitoxin SocA domain-containing protein [Tepidisphaeraceae bacterium]|nr:type II toxin-antitoxin system antitoxin SocA domain-containing protein [Tepidisphaeraceae bacterium]
MQNNVIQPTSSAIVGESLLERARQNGPADVSPMKLLKLVYIAHGWSLAYFDQPLIYNRIEAWKFGPVIPDLYHRIKQFGVGSVPSGVLTGGCPVELSEPQKRLLDTVWKAYGGFDGIRLSAMTHQPNTPWDTVWNKNRGSTYRGAQISNDLIRGHYKQMMHERRDPAAPASA